MSCQQGALFVNRLMVIVLAALLPAYASAASSMAARSSDCVVLLHGLLRSSGSMKGMEWALERKGYRVVNVNYPSWSKPIEMLSQQALSMGIDGCRQDAVHRIHFVSHSLGGILIRYHLARHHLPELGRVVMLGPPNQGSQLADHLLAQRWYPSWGPEAAGQLGTGVRSVPVSLGAVNFELGIVAGTSNRRPLLMAGVNRAEHLISDGTVLVVETKVEGMSDFLSLPVTHTFMMWDREVITQTAFFLKHGYFDRVGRENMRTPFPLNL